MKSVYDPNSSLKLSMGLPPLETGQGRIDLIMDVSRGKVAPTAEPAKERFYKAYNVSYWTMPEADAATWLNEPVRHQHPGSGSCGSTRRGADGRQRRSPFSYRI